MILSEEIDGFTIDGGPDSLLIQKPDGDRALPGDRPRRSTRLHQAAAARLHPARRTPASRCRPRRCSASRRASVRLSRTALFSWPGKLRMGAELFVPPRRDDDGRVDRRVHDAPIRPRSDDLPRRAAAGRHPRRRRRSPVGARAVPAIRRGRAQARQPAARVSGPRACASHAVRRRVQVAARRPERDDSRAGRRAIGESRVRTGVAVAAIDGSRSVHVRTTDGDVIEASAVVLATPAYATSALTADRDADALAAVRRDSVRVGGDRCARLQARRRRSPAERIRLRRAARRSGPAPGGLVAVVEVAASRARRAGAAADVRRRRARSRGARALGRRSSSRCRSRR